MVISGDFVLKLLKLYSEIKVAYFTELSSPFDNLRRQHLEIYFIVRIFLKQVKSTK